MDKRILLFVMPLLVFSLSFAQFGIEFLENNMYWFFVLITTVAVFNIINNIFEKYGRGEIARGVGLFAAAAIFIALYSAREMIDGVIGPFILLILLTIVFLAILSKKFGNKEKESKHMLCIVGFVMIVIGWLLSVLGITIAEYLIILGIVLIMICFIIKIMQIIKPNPNPNPNPDPDDPKSKKGIKVTVLVKDGKSYLLAGAKVEVDGKVETTNSKGEAYFKLKKGIYDFKITKEKCKDLTHTQKISRIKNKVKITLDCGPKPPLGEIDITIHVENEKGEDQSGAKVDFGGMVETTDANGNAEYKHKFYDGHKSVLGGVYNEVYDNVKGIIKDKPFQKGHREIYDQPLYKNKKVKKGREFIGLMNKSIKENIETYKSGIYKKGTTKEMYVGTISGQASYIFMLRVGERLESARLKTAKGYIKKINKKYPNEKVEMDKFLKVLIPSKFGKKASIDVANEILEKELKNHPCYTTLKKGLNEYYTHFSNYTKQIHANVKKLL